MENNQKLPEPLNSYDTNTKANRMGKEQPNYSSLLLIIIGILMIWIGLLRVDTLAEEPQPPFTSHTRPATVNKVPTAIHIAKDGTKTARVQYEHCYKRAWSDEKICDRKIVRVLFDEELPTPKK